MKIENRIYRVSPICKNCGEEHAVFDIEISNEEEQQLEQFYADHRDLNGLGLCLEIFHNPPLIVTRKFRCPECKQPYTASVSVSR